MSEPNWWDKAPVSTPVETAAVGAPVAPANWWEGAPQSAPAPQAAPPVAAAPAPAEAAPATTLAATGKDGGYSFGTGALKGILGTWTLPGNIEYLARLGIDKGAEFLGYDNPGTSEKKPVDSIYKGKSTFLPDYSYLKRELENRATGPLYEPKTTLGKYAQTTGEFLPGGIVGRALTLPQRATTVLAPALASETAGQVTEGTSLEPWARAAGAFAPGTLSRSITPLPIRDPEHARAVGVLDRERVHITAGQRTDSSPLKYGESVTQDTAFAGGGAKHNMLEQGETFTQAVMRRVGENDRRATQPVMDRIFNRIENDFDTVIARNTLRADQQLATDLRTVVGEYNSMKNPTARAPIIDNTIADLVAQFGRQGPPWANSAAGTLDGAAYQSMRSSLGKVGRNTRVSDPELSRAAFGIQHALDDAMERAISPADAAQWRTARNQYRNLLVVENAVGNTGEATAKGIISPAQLASKTIAQNKRSYVRGDGDFAELANAGSSVMKALPQSGTAPRAAAMGSLQVLLGLGGNSAGGPLGAVGAMALPAVAARALMSRPVQGYLGNQALTPIQPHLRQPMMSTAPAQNVIFNEYGEEQQ